MPIYEYRCTECGCEKEYLQKVGEPLKTQCPECGKPALQKKLTAAGFQLKGSGWYVTDFRDSGKKADAKKPAAGADKAAAAGGNGSAESKPAESNTSSAAASSSDGTKSDSPSTAAAGSSAKPAGSASSGGTSSGS